MKTYLKSLLLVSLLLFSALAFADPPGRVGRIAYTDGVVSFRASYNDDPVAAELNWPVTSQNILSTASGARTEIRIGSTSIRLASNSELEITQLDDKHLQLYLTHGSASIRVKNRDAAHDFELDTPQGLVSLTEPSQLRVDAERQPHTTAVNLFSGAARFENTGSNFALRAGNRMEISDGNIRMSDARASEYADEFDNWSAARDQRDDASVSVRYLSPEITGYEELDRNGTWRTTQAYGAVWYPTVVPVNWAPYRAGRWTWIEPWGWTWVDNTSWGYAPSHYGRWVSLDRRWCWVPGTRVARPVWAPALVGWVGGHNWNVTFSAGSAPAVGWFPLAPREVYVPSYRVSPAYVQQINITHVTNITNITNVTRQPDYQNRRVRDAITVMPQEHFSVHRTVVVAPSQARLRQPEQLQAAPVSAVVPTTIARANVMPTPNPMRGERWRDRDGTPRTLSNLPLQPPQQPQQPMQRLQQPAAVTPPAAVAPGVNSGATVVVQPGMPRAGVPPQRDRHVAPTVITPVPPAVTQREPREREWQQNPTRIQPVQPQPQQPIQQPAPVVVQPAPSPRGPGADEARARAQERRDNAAARVERRETPPVHIARREIAPVPVQQRHEVAPVPAPRHEALPVQVERRAVPPPVVVVPAAAAATPAAATPASAARRPDAAKERHGREHEHDAQHPAQGESSVSRGHQPSMER